MDVAIAIVSLLAIVMLGALAAWLLTRMVKTIVELKKITAALRYALGEVLAQPAGRDGVVEGTLTGAEHQLGSG